MKDLGLLSDQYTVLVTGTVQEEDCDGLCWQYIINEDKVRPDFVVSTEPTDGGIYRGQRGRMEIRVDVKGVSCHGSAPERGDNAIYKMADILQDVARLNENDAADDKEVKGLVKMLDEKYNPEWQGSQLPGPRNRYGFRDLLHLPQPLRRGGLLLRFPGPPNDRRRDLGELPG